MSELRKGTLIASEIIQAAGKLVETPDALPKKPLTLIIHMGKSGHKSRNVRIMTSSLRGVNFFDNLNLSLKLWSGPFVGILHQMNLLSIPYYLKLYLRHL